MDNAIPPLQRRQARLAHWLGLPATILMLLIYIVPISLVLLASFTDYTLVSDYYEFIGFDNYTRMFGDEVVGNSLKNTVFYAALFLPGAFIISLILAITIQEQKQFRSILEVLYFLPVTSTLAAMTLVWGALMDSSQGVINNMIEIFGFAGINWFGSEDVVLYSLAIISLWSVIGFNMVLFLAGLTSIPQSLYEAASMDGADHPLDKFFKITWPMLGPTAMFVAVTSSITAFKLFDTVAILTQGGPDRASEVFLYLTFLEGFEYFNMGYSAALSLVFLGIIFLFALAQALLTDKNVHY